MLRPAFSLVIGNKGCDIAAGTGHTADEGADEGGTQKRGKHSLDILKRRQQTVQHHVLLLTFIMIIILNTAQHLRKSEHADQHRDKGYTAHKIVGVQGKADSAAHAVNADSCQKQADKTAHNTLDNAARGNARNNAEAENSQSKIFRLGKLQCNLRQLRCQQNQADGTENTAEGAGQGGKAESTSRLPHLRRHRVAVQRSRYGSRRTRSFQQNCRNTAAVNRTAVNAQQHQNAADTVKGKGQRKQQRQAHVNAQTGHTAEGNAYQHAEEKSQQIHGDENHI